MCDVFAIWWNTTITPKICLWERRETKKRVSHLIRFLNDLWINLFISLIYVHLAVILENKVIFSQIESNEQILMEQL